MVYWAQQIILIFWRFKLYKKSLHNTAIFKNINKPYSKWNNSQRKLNWVCKKKNSKAALLNHLKYHHFYYFYCLLWLGSMTSEKFEFRDKILTKSKTANHWSISTPQQVRPKQYCFQTNLIEPCRLGKIGLNFDIPSPTKFVNFFSFFEKLATDYLKQLFWEASSCIKKLSNRTFENLETPIQLLHLRKNKILNFE